MLNSRTSLRWRLLILLAIVSVAVGSTVNAQARQTNSTASENLRSIDSLLSTFYESLSFPEGKSPDWVAFRNLFAAATSPCVRIAGDNVMQMDRDGFIKFFSGRIERGELRSFREKEIRRTGEYYGSVAQVFSTYIKEMNLADHPKPIRGINSFQLFFANNRWWITSVAWQDESPEKPIPERYLK